VAVLIPVLARPWRVDPLLLSLRSSERLATVAPIFVALAEDEDEIDAIEQADAPALILPGPLAPGDYARKVNAAVRAAADLGALWVFLGADDLCFCHGWADEALRVATDTRKPVVGTNDLGNRSVIRGHTSTHTLVATRYALERGAIDDPSRLLHEGYFHNFVDREMIETARYRNELAFATRSRVEHLHPNWRKAKRDATYDRGLDRERFNDDARLFRRRAHLWGGRT
jgi:hypothetical protein